ncbi:MAG: biopolymer transporter ExbD [Bdellovibrionaceae bacterium]|nr:biopolymer transporter ExbD [Pseudobdellovibrionaceae bacterium]
MDLESLDNPRKYPLTLQLAPMIDIFFLIIVFLLKATIVADVSIVFPREMHPPMSRSKETLETFPEVVVTETEIIVGIIHENLNLAEVEKLSEERVNEIKSKVEQYVKSKDEKVRSQATHVNLITYRGNNYKNIFASVKFLRKIGFQSVAFIAEGEGQ